MGRPRWWLLFTCGVVLVFPVVAWAHDCSAPDDCWDSARGGAAAAGGIAGALGGLYSLGRGMAGNNQRGFRFIVPRKGATTLHKDPSPDSPVVGQPPNGSRVLYTETRKIGGKTWYYVRPTGATPGWVPGDDTRDTRPIPPPPARPSRPWWESPSDSHRLYPPGQGPMFEPRPPVNPETGQPYGPASTSASATTSARG